MAYATIDDVAEGFRPLSEDEAVICTRLLEEAAIIIDSMAKNAEDDAKRLVSSRMVRRSTGVIDQIQAPIGATQGTISALGYSQSFTISGGSVGELYVTKAEQRLLGLRGRIGFANPLGGDDNA